ncbi:hypothetical protein [Flectobacillus major]|uniref:hypothetical protein n=1 Tax=Flectobacillus major TaxID=103 RepID=UPI001182A312|nr:hypothetical protein [Flectobacillus major]
MNHILCKLGLMVVSIVAIMSSCKESDLDGVSSSGQPVINRVYVLDTVARHKDSTIVGAEPNTLLVINGQNLGGVIRAYFNEYETSFNTNYNTNTDLIIRLPADAPTDSTATNKIRLVTARGEAIFAFKVIAKPNVASYDIVNFGKGRGNITFKGKNFADVTKVVAYAVPASPTTPVKDSLICTIVSKATDKLVVNVPTTTLSRITFHITNSSGTTRYADEFVNADVALPVFTEDFGPISSADGQGVWTGDSWGNPVTVNSDQAFAGKKSVSVAFNVGGWSWFGFTSWWPRFYYTSEYKYFTFAIKGGAYDLPLWITSDASKAGFAEFTDKNQILVRAKVWNYYKIAIADLDFMYSGSIVPRLGFRPKGPDKADLIYLDDIMFVK